MDIYFPDIVPIDSPEPSTLVLGALAAATLLGRRLLRRARAVQGHNVQ